MPLAKRSADELVRIAEAQGWRVERSTKGWKFYPPDKTKQIVVIHGSASDHRWYMNAVSRLKRSGLVIR